MSVVDAFVFFLLGVAAGLALAIAVMSLAVSVV